MREESLIDKLIREVMAAKGLTQQDLAELTGSSLSRVKAITSSRVAKLKPEEIKALVEELHVSADWLATGAGPMFRPQLQTEDQDAFARRVQAIKTMSVVVDALPLPDVQRERLKVRLTGDPVQDGVLIAGALESLNPALTADEVEMVKRYRTASKDGRDLISLAVKAADQGSAGKRKKAA